MVGDKWGSSEAQLVQRATWDEGRDPGGEGVSLLSVVVDAPPLHGWPHHPTHLLAAGIVTELIIAGMQRLPCVDGIQDHLVPHNHLWGQAEQGEGRRARPPGPLSGLSLPL